jgi:hypothetical protein
VSQCVEVSATVAVCDESISVCAKEHEALVRASKGIVNGGGGAEGKVEEGGRAARSIKAQRWTGRAQQSCA